MSLHNIRLHSLKDKHREMEEASTNEEVKKALPAKKTKVVKHLPVKHKK